MVVWTVAQGLVLVAAGLLVMAAMRNHRLGKLEWFGREDVPYWGSIQAGGKPAGAESEDECDFHRAVALLVDFAAHGLVDIRREHTGSGLVRWRVTKQQLMFETPLGSRFRFPGLNPRKRFSVTTRDLTLVVEEASREVRGRSARVDWTSWGTGARLEGPLLLVPLGFLVFSAVPVDWEQGPDPMAILTAVVGTAVLSVALIFTGRSAAEQERAARQRNLAGERDLEAEQSDQWLARPETGLAYLVHRRPLQDPQCREILKEELRTAAGRRANRYTHLVDLAGALLVDHAELSGERRAEREQREREYRRRLEQDRARARERFEHGWRVWEERNGRRITEEEYRSILDAERKEEERRREQRLRRFGGGGFGGGDSGGGFGGPGGGDGGGGGGP